MTGDKTGGTRVFAGLTVAVACVGMFVTVLDANVVTVALPSIGAQLGGGVEGLQWIVDGYALMFAALLLSAGAISDRIGPSRCFGIGLGLFTLASAACGLAPAMPALVAARFVQGAAAALLLPASLSLVRHAYDDPAARARGVAIWTAGGGIAMAAAPLAGGLLTSALGWPAIFFINVPAGIFGLVGLMRAPRPEPHKTALDVPGQVLCVLAMAAVVFSVIRAGSSGIDLLGVIALVVFLVAAAAFIVVEKRSKHPAVPLELFRAPVTIVTTLTGFALCFAFYGTVFVMTLYFQQLRGESALVTGLIFVPMTALTAVINVAAGRMVGRYGPRPPMVIGLLILAVGMVGLLFVTTATATWIVVLLLVPVGVGGALATPAMTSALIDSVESHRSGLASGILNAARQLGGAVGVAACGAFVAGLAFAAGMTMSLIVGGVVLVVAAVATALLLPGGAKRSRRDTDSDDKEEMMDNDPERIVRTFVEAVGRGDLDVALALLADDVVLEMVYALPERRTRWEGREEVSNLYTSVAASITSIEHRDIEVQAFARPGRVLAEYVGRVTTPDGAHENHYVMIIDVRDGKLIRLREFYDTFAQARSLGLVPGDAVGSR
ncbi:DHA2 family methylenomycin A resistance protein-like MFS transporter [Kutzneria kofuensis]|uniref:DHA2 family methylenomycin A resistance protein-like MFS transporter n=2 Tax=Kutzneria kofuensis TaxID=103725 RepID=A0A7W9KQV0_9PSEU|nr:MFS transporter [Kutzneria kofuensis]MBB5897014.1 DHA2 family methylenomycin A resistance protein-like MFS transporter [Kutzneria kofuensis]